ncbi:hypothetical protein CYY_001822 [Polysphondylium violaceum]|uniref:Uncharacterized protein n=1 Tax=Polysphondylium violaceum TaxID=133409 RepID=A0A8J4Q0X9_9MYCE|nr:hypothetical protein CYY_001822 [Polysphondylium violaceum]
MNDQLLVQKLNEHNFSFTLPQHPIPPLGLNVHPLVVLVGWIKALPKHLDKYKKFYLDNGFCTITLTPSPMCHFFPHRMRELALSLVEFLNKESDKTSRPIIFQVFSGNMVYQSEIFKLLNDNKDKYEKLINLIKGQIFDSCPSMISERVAYTSLTATSKSKIQKTVLKYICAGYSKIVDVEKANNDFWNRLSKCPIPTPQLYIYSIDDAVTSYLDVERGIEIMKSQNINVRQLCFDQSLHVNHFSVHPMRYMKNVYQFWEFCLKTNNTTSPTLSTSNKFKFLNRLLVPKL